VIPKKVYRELQEKFQEEAGHLGKLGDFGSEGYTPEKFWGVLAKRRKEVKQLQPEAELIPQFNWVPSATQQGRVVPTSYEYKSGAYKPVTTEITGTLLQKVFPKALAQGDIFPTRVGVNRPCLQPTGSQRQYSPRAWG
jgi:hypothetical protein